MRPSRWKLRTIRASLPWLSGYSLSGVWRVLERSGLTLRSGRVQHYSPDPDYVQKKAVLMNCLAEAARAPQDVVFLFLDEMGYYRWPEVAPDWGQRAPRPAPLAQRQESKQKQWRVIGVMNALTGQVNYLDGYVVGRKKVIEMYHRIESVYGSQRQIYVAQDNWSIHKHPEVEAALAELPRIDPVWLPTYAPWLNPIEKLWRWLKEDVLKMHRLAGHWQVLRESVNGFLDQFAEGSERLLGYVGLRGEGKMARIIQCP